MLATAPAEVFLHDTVHRWLVAALEPESDRQCDLATVVKYAGVVTELHVIAIDGFATAILTEELSRVENLGDEHRTLTLRCRGEKVQILPHCAADGAGNAYVVFQSG